MADKSASIKLSLKSSAFVSGMRDNTKTVKTEAGTMGSALRKSLSDGVKGASDAVKGLFSSVKATITSMSGLAGGISIAGGLKQALAMEGQYKKLAFAIRAGTGESVKWKDIQKQVQQTSLETGQSTEDLVHGYSKLFKDTGDKEFAGKAIKSVGIAAAGSGESIETLAEIAGTLNEKFNVTAEELPEALAAAISFGNKGGVTVEQMAEKLGLVGAAAKEAGLSGKDGFGKVAALLNVADNSTGNFKKALGAVTGIIDTLGNKAERNKALGRLGLVPSQVKGDAIDTIGAILKKTNGNKDKLAMAFQGPQLQVLADLGQNYAKVFKETQGDVKTKTAAAIASFDAAIAQAGKSELSAADISEKAATALESPTAQIASALTRLEAAFNDVDVKGAIKKLSKVIPLVADLLGGVASSPGLAVGAGVTAVAGKGFAEAGAAALMKAAFSSGGKDAAGQIATGMSGGGKGFMSAAQPLLIAAIIAGWTAAIEQGFKLKKDLENLDDQDKKQLKTELKKTGATWLKNQTMGLVDVFSDQDYQQESENNLGIETGSVLDAGNANRRKDAAIAVQEAAMSGGQSNAGAFSSQAPQVSSVPQSAGPNPQFGPLISSLNKELRVRVVNPQDIRTGGATAPGWKPR